VEETLELCADCLIECKEKGKISVSATEAGVSPAGAAFEAHFPPTPSPRKGGGGATSSGKKAGKKKPSSKSKRRASMPDNIPTRVPTLVGSQSADGGATGGTTSHSTDRDVTAIAAAAAKMTTAGLGGGDGARVASPKSLGHQGKKLSFSDIASTRGQWDRAASFSDIASRADSSGL
jgi:hypothetical protein